MNRRHIVPCLLVLFFALSAAAPAAPPTGLDARISLELEAAAAQEVLASFGQVLDRETTVDPEITGSVTIELHNVRTATALTAVCESVGCLWHIEGGHLMIQRDPAAQVMKAASPPASGAKGPVGLDTSIDIKLKAASLRETLLAFGSIAGMPVELGEAIEGEVTIDLRNTPARKAFDAICEAHGCRWEVVETADGPVLRVTPR
jgi:type II secretory pathway component GspD/PulD (secretin)